MKNIWLYLPILLSITSNSFSDSNLDSLDRKNPNQGQKNEYYDYGTMLLAGDVDALTDTAINAAVEESVGISKSFLERYFPTVEIGFKAKGGQKPTSNILIVAPLSDEKDIFNTVFTQISGNYQDNRTTLNLGLGYRKLSQNKKTLLGVNAFYDHEFPYNHGRTSLGVEALSTMWEMRGNKYWATTDWKKGRGGLNERALDGYDIEAGIPIPYMNWATVFVKHFEWDAYDGKADPEGQDVSLRARFPGALTGLELEAGRTFYRESYDDESFILISYNLTEIFKKDKTNRQPWINKTAYQLESMEDQRFQKVRRSNTIVKQVQFSAKAKGI